MNSVVGKPAEWTPSAVHPVRVRPATADDRGFAMSLVPSLVASCGAHWRIPRKVHAAYVAVIESLLISARSQSVLLIGEQEIAGLVGIALLSIASDCFTRRRLGHLAQVVVRENLEESVQAQALIEATRTWACTNGLTVLTPLGFWSRHPSAALCRWTGNVAPPKKSISRQE